MTERLFSPKTILTAVRDIEFTNLRHLRTRKDMNFIKPFTVSTKKGQKNLYSLIESLKYILSCKFEATGFDIRTSANMAEIIMEFKVYDKNQWIIYLFGEKPENNIFFFRPKLSKPKLSEKLEEKYKSKDIKYFFINPLPETYFVIKNEDFSKFIKSIGGKIIRSEFIDVDEIVMDSLNRLNVSRDEYEKMAIETARKFEKLVTEN